MSKHERSFWMRLEMLVMAAACGTLLGTGLLAGIISFGAGDVATSNADITAPSIVLRGDEAGYFRAHVIIDGVPVQMIVDTGAAQTRLSLPDALSLPHPTQESANANAPASYRADRVELAGKTLRGATLELNPASLASVIGRDWLAQLGPVTLAPAYANSMDQPSD